MTKFVEMVLCGEMESEGRGKTEVGEGEMGRGKKEGACFEGGSVLVWSNE